MGLSDEASESSDGDGSLGWLGAFLQRPASRLFVRIDPEFLQNTFNITGISAGIANVGAAHRVLVQNSLDPAHGDALDQDAGRLYGMLHLRFLLTKSGQQAMFERYRKMDFPGCPRVNCRSCICLPYGIRETLGEPVKWFCPNCQDIYRDARFNDIDGAFFGHSWIHIFLQKFRQSVSRETLRVYVPKIFGFRMCHESDRVDERPWEDEDEDE